MSLNVSDELCHHLAQLLEANRSELMSHYQSVLREAMFDGRSKMRPNMLKKIASEEVDAFGDFLHQPEQHVLARGAQLHQFGLSEQPLLRMGQVTRQFFVKRLESDQIAPTLELIDTYQEQVVRGFIHGLETAVFNVQERTRRAFERVVNRDSL